MVKHFEVKELEIKDVKLITPFFVEDERGYFLKNMEKDVYKKWGIDADIYEDFETLSTKGVIRGLHFQIKNPQAKIVHTIIGEVRDIVVDIRKNSPTFGKYVDVLLNDRNHNILWIPPGFAHGFEVFSDTAIMSYKCVGKYEPEYDTGIRWNDAELNINWKTSNPILSKKDAELMSFEEYIQKCEV